MANFPVPFNAHQVEPASISNMLPISDSKGHLVIISSSEFLAAKSGGNNGYLNLVLSIVDGPEKGQFGNYRLNLYNDNPQTVDIASRQLSAICHVTGQMMISDSSQLHNIPFRAVVGLQKKGSDWKQGDPEYTEVKGVLDAQGNKPGKSGASGGPGPASQPAATQQATPAWAGQQPQGQPIQPQQPAQGQPSAPPWAR